MVKEQAKKPKCNFCEKDAMLCVMGKMWCGNCYVKFYNSQIKEKLDNFQMEVNKENAK